MNKIEINGKQYPCRITMGAMLRFKRETGHDVSQVQNDDVSDLITFLWCCIASACAGDGVTFGLSLMDFADGLDPDTLNRFFNEMKNDGDPEKKTGDPTS